MSGVKTDSGVVLPETSGIKVVVRQAPVNLLEILLTLKEMVRGKNSRVVVGGNVR